MLLIPTARWCQEDHHATQWLFFLTFKLFCIHSLVAPYYIHTPHCMKEVLYRKSEWKRAVWMWLNCKRCWWGSCWKRCFVVPNCVHSLRVSIGNMGLERCQSKVIGTPSPPPSIVDTPTLPASSAHHRVESMQLLNRCYWAYWGWWCVGNAKMFSRKKNTHTYITKTKWKIDWQRIVAIALCWQNESSDWKCGAAYIWFRSDMFTFAS